MMTTALVKSQVARPPATGSAGSMSLGSRAVPVSALDELVFRRRSYVHQQAAALDDWTEKHAFLADYDLLGFDQYRQALGIIERWRRELSDVRAFKDGEDTPAVRGFFKRYNRNRHTPDEEGWTLYLKDHTPKLAASIDALSTSVLLPEPPRVGHTLITAKPNWGKTELVKALVHHYVAHERAAVVVVDPHGDMAEQIAMWPELRDSDRLVYIEPELIPGQTVGLNPLACSGLNPSEIAKLASEMGTAIGEMSSDLTTNMRTIAHGCSRLMLEDGNATLYDLLDLIDSPPKGQAAPTPESENQARWLDRGRQHPTRIMRRFFNRRIHNDSFKSSREGIDNRVTGLLMLPEFEAMTCGRATIDLHSLVDQRKIIVFNLAKFERSAASALGRLVIAMMASIADRRKSRGDPIRVPCHLFVDEAQTMASASTARILFECRKFGIHLTLSQQVEGVNFDDVGQKALAEATGTKLVGSNRSGPLRGVFEDEPRPAGEKVGKHEFWVKWGDAEPFRLHVRGDLVSGPPDRNSDAWRAMQDRQRKHYRPLWEEPPPAPAVEVDELPELDAPPPAPPPASPALEMPKKSKKKFAP